ncbi:MAG: STAS domain-containing protein [Clostridia bacterium]|nr:STAS domain-containing protein [Clostridia bacterium]
MINFDYESGVLVVYIGGEIDHHNAKGLREEIDMLILQLTPKRLVLDFNGVSFMDSSGLGLVLGRYTKARAADIEFAVSNADRRILQIFEMAGMDRLINFEGKKVV